jgi:hypothetical protein
MLHHALQFFVVAGLQFHLQFMTSVLMISHRFPGMGFLPTQQWPSSTSTALLFRLDATALVLEFESHVRHQLFEIT